MKTFVIITPFFRPHNVLPLLGMWGRMFSNPSGVNPIRWLMMVASKKNPEPSWWIWEADCTPPESGWDPCYYKCNEAISRLENVGMLNKDHFVGFLPDDDCYDDGFFDALMPVVGDDQSEVIVTSSRRHNGTRLSEPGILRANPENMRICHVGLEQFFVRGDVLKSVPRFENVSHADGLMVERLFARNKDGFRYLPDTFVNFNILPP
jgi:hypothetical protein